MTEKAIAAQLKILLREKSATDSLKILASRFQGKTVFTTSFGNEDQVITDIIFRYNLNIEVVTLDTGRLFPETYTVFNETIGFYRKEIRTYFPDYLGVEKIVNEKGPFSFYKSYEDRLECCRMRKVLPLARALRDKKCWITGIRSGQSEYRNYMDWIEYDEDKELFKFYPLYNWTAYEVESYIRENNVPYNSLHDKGYPSIGCEPCTRPVRPGEDPRSGRWWWETEGVKECGCHLK